MSALCLTLMLLVANLVNVKCQKRQKSWEMTEALVYGYSSYSTQQELSNEYPHDLVEMIFVMFCNLMHWTKVTSASEGLRYIFSGMILCKGR